MELAGKVIVVTGAASGIGAALCRRFVADRPAVVVAVDRDIKGVGRVAAEVGGLAIEADVAEESDTLRVIEVTEDRYGSIDLFCANAGIAFSGDEQTPDSEWERMWRINFMAHVYAARHLIPRWQSRGDGYFLSTASAAGLITNLGALQYTVTKHAAVALAEWLAITYGDAGIKVSCLCPQGVLTPMLEAAGEQARLIKPTALNPDHVANIVADGLRAEKFLILPHSEVARYVMNKASDRDRWIEGMQRLQRSLPH